MVTADLKNCSDVQHVADVAKECTEHMHQTERRLVASDCCTSNANQPDLSDRMRAILISWLVEVHLKYTLQAETLFITVNLVDRYCEVRQVPRSEYQLLGVTAMLIACKYEEIFVPKIEDFVDITDNTYTKEQILRQEFQILKALSYDITFPTVYRFLERFHTVSQASQETLFLAQYLTELCLIEVKMNKWVPSRVASSSLYLAKKMLRQPTPWPKEMQLVCQLSEKQVRDCARDICILINLAHQRKVFEPIFRKYSTQRFMRVAQVPVRIRSESTRAETTA